MIRFSAGLVVVALGVLIGGVVTSKLSLVYVSIAVSVVALIAWGIGVFLKRGELREELFGGRPELVPAGAGVGAGLSAPERSASGAAVTCFVARHCGAVGGTGPPRLTVRVALTLRRFHHTPQVRPTWRPTEPGATVGL